MRRSSEEMLDRYSVLDYEAHLLRGLAASRGIQHKVLALELDLTKCALSLKMRGKVAFSEDEMTRLADIFHVQKRDLLASRKAWRERYPGKSFCSSSRHPDSTTWRIERQEIVKSEGLALSQYMHDRRKRARPLCELIGLSCASYSLMLTGESALTDTDIRRLAKELAFAPSDFMRERNEWRDRYPGRVFCGKSMRKRTSH